MSEVVVDYIWDHLLQIQRCGFIWCMLNSLYEVVKAWRVAPFHGCDPLLWRFVPLTILWSLWKERKYRIFKVMFGNQIFREKIFGFPKVVVNPCLAIVNF